MPGPITREKPATSGARRHGPDGSAFALMVTSNNLMTMKKSNDKQVPAGKFKAKCLALFDEVEARRHTFVITKRGRPVARIVPLSTGKPSSLRGSLLYEEELLTPIDTKWDVRS